MTNTVVSIHRKDNLRQARLLAEYVRFELRMPPNAVTGDLIERFADMLEEARVWRQGKLDRWTAEFDGEMAALRAELARIRALWDAWEAFDSARKTLHEALKECRRP